MGWSMNASRLTNAAVIVCFSNFVRVLNEEKATDSVRQGETTKASLLIEIDRLKVQLAEQRAHSDTLNAQVDYCVCVLLRIKEHVVY
jgi:hypothetical protein